MTSTKKTMVYTARDGRRFLSAGATKTYNMKLFANEHLTTIQMENSSEIKPLFLASDEGLWNDFIDYLVHTHSVDFEVYRGLFSKYKNKFIIIYGAESILKTTVEYAKELESRKKQLQNYLNALKACKFSDISFEN